MIHSVTTIADPCLEPFRNLPEKTLRDDKGLLIAEGAWLVERLLVSNLTTIAVLTTEKKCDDFAALVPDDVPLYVAPDDVLSAIVGYAFHSGVLAAAKRPDNPPLAALLPDKPDARATVLVCPRITNPDNLGSILRSAAGFGVDGVLLGGQCSDLWRRQTLRVSMGAALQLPVRVSDNLDSDLATLRTAHGVSCVATVLDDKAEKIETSPRDNRMALLLGPEDFGLDAQWLAHCDRQVTIPMGVVADSLNVAIAAAVFLYHFTRAAKCT